VPEGIFDSYKGLDEANTYSLEKGYVISKILEGLTGDEAVICTTGKIGREFYEQNRLAENKCASYFLCVGAMGHANHVALAVNIHSDRRVVMLDGDGALLMHMGALPTIAHHASNDMIHIILNNGRHESVGGQPTEAFFADLCGVAKSCGYPTTLVIEEKATFLNWIETGLNSKGLQFVEIRVSGMGRMDLPRPGGSPSDWRKDFMKTLGKKN
jgi:phosphonopyruvate decarboxylase